MPNTKQNITHTHTYTHARAHTHPSVNPLHKLDMMLLSSSPLWRSEKEADRLVQGGTVSLGQSARIQSASVWLQRGAFAVASGPVFLQTSRSGCLTPPAPRLTHGPLFCHQLGDGLTAVLVVPTHFHYMVGVLWDSTTGCFSNLFNSSIMFWSHLLFYIGQM